MRFAVSLRRLPLEKATSVLTCASSLFRPYIKLDLRGANLYPRDTCTFCANEISGLTNALRAMYGLRRVCLPVTGFLLSASTIHLLNLPNETSRRHLSQAMYDMQTMSANHFFAGRCVDIIRSLASKWKINLPDDAPPVSPSKPSGRKSGSPKSAFYSASIPRQDSSQSGTRSADSQESHPSRTSNHDSPFAPPVPSSHPQDTGSGSGSSFYNDQYPSMDQISMQQQSFWLPFPVQSMPNPGLADMQTSNTLNSYVDATADHQWQQQYSMPVQNQAMQQQHLQHQFQPRQQQTPVGGVRADDQMGNSYENWHW